MVVLVSMAVGVPGCLSGNTDEWVGPNEVILRFDRPRREVRGVHERWMLVREHDESFLLHAFDVERRRAKQRCGTIDPTVFATGWDELLASGLLDPVDDLRFAPRPGEPPFVGRLELSFLLHGRRVEARRPLDASQAAVLERVLRGWKRAVLIEDPQTLPALMRVEARQGGCDMERPPRDKDVLNP